MLSGLYHRRQFLVGAGLCCLGWKTFAAQAAPRFGPEGTVGPQGEPRRPPIVGQRWDIIRRTTYENLLFDLRFADHEAVRIRTPGVTLRHCEFRYGRNDAIEIYADDVRIQHCHIHHFLAGTFQDQQDAHGITGQARRLLISHCEISHCSGDAWQMDPDRGPWTDVILEHCHIWRGPLELDMAGFRRGEQPGEDGVDTKQSRDNPRSRLTIRHCVFHGFRAAGYVDFPAAINVKENVDVVIEHCLFYNNHCALRLRGPGKHGGAHVVVRDCYFYDCEVAIRMEDRLEQIEIINPHFGEGVRQRYQRVAGKPVQETITGEEEAPPLATLLKPPSR